MSTRNSSNLNVQGLAMNMKQPNDQACCKPENIHNSCKREIDKLKKELNLEKNNCKKMKVSLSETENYYKDIESTHIEVLSSITTKHAEEIQLQQSKHKNEIQLQQRKHKEEIQLLQSKHKDELEDDLEKFHEISKKLNEQRTKFQNIICEKDEQIRKLKIQVAQSLEINSKERHKQIDELVNELQSVSDEANYLKDALNNLQSSNKNKCQKCSFYETKYKELAGEMAVQTENCKTLVGICSKMESQLSQQDDLCMLLTNIKEKL